MRIAYVYDAVHPWVTGGVERRVWELATRLATDHDVHWYGLRYWDGPAVRQKDGITLHGVADPPENLYVNGRRSIPEALSFATNLVPPLLEEEFDVIDCQEFPYFPVFSTKLASVLDGSRMFLTWHEIWTDYWYDYLGYAGVFGRAIEYLVAYLPNAHIVVSDRTRRDAVGLGIDDPILVPNGISLDDIERVDPIPADVDVLFAGRFIPEKNVGLLVDALDRLGGDVSAVLVGEGPGYEAIERRVERLGLGNVSLPGFLDSHDELLGTMKAADVFVLPSEREGFGITALEALACGTPVVTLDHPKNAARDLVTDGETGAICKRTPESLAAAIESARRSARNAECKAAARPYDWDRIAERIETVYRRGGEPLDTDVEERTDPIAHGWRDVI